MSAALQNPRSLTADEAIERLYSWIEPPPEHEQQAMLAAVVRFARGEIDEPSFRALSKAYASMERRRTHRLIGIFGADVDFEVACADLRRSKIIYEAPLDGMAHKLGHRIQAQIGNRWFHFQTNEARRG